MGKVLLCTGEYAKKPYYFENVCVNVYCIEELCCLLAANPFMIDVSIMDKSLAEWIETECGLKDLGRELLLLLRRGMQPGIFVDTIMDYVKYNEVLERKKIKDTLTDSAGLSEYERKKKQGDFLLQNGRYQIAITEYDKILRELEDGQEEFGAVIYHNMGVAYSKLFRFDSAARYLKKAYELSGDRESGIQYLIAKRETMSESEYISFLAENGQYYELSLEVEARYKEVETQFEATRESRMISALSIYKEEGNTASYYEEIDRVITGLKETYRGIVVS